MARSSRDRSCSATVDPVDELRHAGVDSGVERPRAPAAKADDAVQPPSTTHVADERTTGVALARVPAAGQVPGAQHVVRDDVAVELGMSALSLRHDRNDHLPQNRRKFRSDSYTVQRTR